MPKPALPYDAVASLLCRFATDQLSESDLLLLKGWVKKSAYNQSLLDDLSEDIFLRQLIIKSYQDGDGRFWDIMIPYRAAMHPFMPPRLGNFWQRVFKLKT